jgi:hypothetical protein
MNWKSGQAARTFLNLVSFRIDIDPYQPSYLNEVEFSPAAGVVVNTDHSHLLYWSDGFVNDSSAALIMMGKYLVGIQEEVMNASSDQASSITRSIKRTTYAGFVPACSALFC